MQEILDRFSHEAEKIKNAEREFASMIVEYLPPGTKFKCRWLRDEIVEMEVAFNMYPSTAVKGRLLQPFLNRDAGCEETIPVGWITEIVK